MAGHRVIGQRKRGVSTVAGKAQGRTQRFPITRLLREVARRLEVSIQNVKWVSASPGDESHCSIRARVNGRIGTFFVGSESIDDYAGTDSAGKADIEAAVFDRLSRQLGSHLERGRMVEEMQAALLFKEYDLGGVLKGQRARMLDAIDAYPASDLRHRSTEDLTAHLAHEFEVRAPELIEGATSVEVSEGQVDVSQDWNRVIIDRSEPFYVPCARVTYYVPFTGQRELFRCRPSTWSNVLPCASVMESELAFVFERADADVPATRAEFDSELQNVRRYLQWVSRDVENFNSEVSKQVAQALQRRLARIRQIDAGTQALGIPVRSAVTSRPKIGSHGPSTAEGSRMPERYDVALTFAGEDRQYVEKVAEVLSARGVTIFYDRFEQVFLWGKNLIDHLAEIYRNRCRYVVMFMSHHYVNKAWPTHERTHVQARALVSREEYILPVRFDDTPVPGLAATIGHIDLREVTPDQLGEMITAKLGKSPAPDDQRDRERGLTRNDHS